MIIMCTDVTRAGMPMIIISTDEDPSNGSKAIINIRGVSTKLYLN